MPFHLKNLPKGRNFTYLEDPGIDDSIWFHMIPCSLFHIQFRTLMSGFTAFRKEATPANKPPPPTQQNTASTSSCRARQPCSHGWETWKSLFFSLRYLKSMPNTRGVTDLCGKFPCTIRVWTSATLAHVLSNNCQHLYTKKAKLPTSKLFWLHKKSSDGQSLRLTVATQNGDHVSVNFCHIKVLAS